MRITKTIQSKPAPIHDLPLQPLSSGDAHTVLGGQGSGDPIPTESISFNFRPAPRPPANA